MRSRLHPFDASFYNLDRETTHQAIASFSPFDRPPDPHLFVKSIESLFPVFPRLRQQVVSTPRLHWIEDPEFELANHLRFVEIPHAASMADLIEQAGRDFSKPFDLNRPMWRFALYSTTWPEDTPFLERHDSGTRSSGAPLSALLFSAHHSFADGLGALEILNTLSNGFKENRRRPEVKAKAEKETGGSSRRVTSPVRSLLKLLHDTLGNRGASPLNGENSTTRTFAIAELPLRTLKELKRERGGSLNDLMLTLVSSAVRRYHLVRSIALEDMRVLIPVSTRLLAGRRDLGNHLTAATVPLPLTPADPISRLNQIKAATESLKKSGAVGSYALFGEINSRLPRKLQRAITESLLKRTNFICTNLPATLALDNIGGAKALGIYGVVALVREQGVGFSFVTHDNVICASVVVDPNIVADPDELIGYLKEAYEEMLALKPSSSLSSATSLPH